MNRTRKNICTLLISIIQITIACETKHTIIIDNQAEWKDITLKSKNISIEKSNNLNGVIMVIIDWIEKEEHRVGVKP